MKVKKLLKAYNDCGETILIYSTIASSRMLTRNEIITKYGNKKVRTYRIRMYSDEIARLIICIK